MVILKKTQADKEKIKALKIINDNVKQNYIEFNKVKTLIRDDLGKYFYHETECNPMILLLITEV